MDFRNAYGVGEVQSARIMCSERVEFDSIIDLAPCPLRQTRASTITADEAVATGRRVGPADRAAVDHELGAVSAAVRDDARNAMRSATSTSFADRPS